MSRALLAESSEVICAGVWPVYHQNWGSLAATPTITAA